MKKKGSDKTLKVIGGSTNANIEWIGRALNWVEIMLERKLNCLVCALHTNELPLQHLTTTLDGATLSNNKWSGSSGKLLNDATALDINPFFKKIYIGDPFITLTDNVIKDLSTNQFYGYKIVSSNRSGNIPKDSALLEIGPVNHSRWLTTANILCRIWVSKHELEGKNLKNLELILEFIVGANMSM